MMAEFLPAVCSGDTQFDRILLDAPCSATGVIRRHPDIKWLRRDRDINRLSAGVRARRLTPPQALPQR
jgi:16S rRNA C967 or C1407 C5-methylase (RsmB/RsmF family)